MTRRTDNLLLDPTDRLDVHPVDASRHRLGDGDRVTVRSRHGEAHLTVQVSDDMTPGQVFCAFHFPASGVNALTSDRGDAATSCPEYKVTAVRLLAGERAGQAR
ncbi:molybdopterin dinucleotide binding domain-containing protein [Nonomuraea salmonea]